MTCWLHITPSFWPTTRASASVPPPGGKPTTMRTGPVGQACARSAGGAERGDSAGGGLENETSLHDVVSEKWVRAAQAAAFKGSLRMRGEEIHRRLHAAAGERDAGELQAHLDAGERGHQGQVVAVAEVADAEHAALDLAQAGAEREVEALVDELAQRVGVDARRRDDAGQHRRIDALASAHWIGRPQAPTAARTPRPSAGAARTPPRAPAPSIMSSDSDRP